MECSQMFSDSNWTILSISSVLKIPAGIPALDLQQAGDQIGHPQSVVHQAGVHEVEGALYQDADIRAVHNGHGVLLQTAVRGAAGLMFSGQYYNINIWHLRLHWQRM